MAKIFSALVCIVCALWVTPVWASDVAVYLPGFQTSYALNRTLREACPSIDFTVFGRSQDYLRSVHKDSPQVIITLDHASLRSDTFKTTRSPDSAPLGQEFVLASFDSIEGIPKTIGVSNYYGRKAMLVFVQSLTSKETRVRVTNRLEDLLPLLRFKRADGIIVTKTEVAQLQERTKSNFILEELTVSQSTPVMASKNSFKDIAFYPKLVRCVQSYEYAGSGLGGAQW